MEWKDELIPGASRTPIPAATGRPSDVPGTAPVVLDTYGQPVYRNDWVYAGQGRIKISGEGDDPRNPSLDSNGYIVQTGASTQSVTTDPGTQPVQVLSPSSGGTNPIVTAGQAQSTSPTADVSTGGGLDMKTVLLVFAVLALIVGAIIVAKRKGKTGARSKP